MVFRDKEIINLLKAIDRKLDMVIVMKKTEKIKSVNKSIRKGD